jgi:glycosyltransferase involved in cell wall biosynthesis
LKLAFVVQRYGAEIAGGSEAHCRELAERLSARHDITVLTTCSRDYVTWQNTLPAGTTSERGVRVLRFPVAQPRRLKTFADLSDEVFDGRAPLERQAEWFHENGPVVPALLEHLRRDGSAYDLVLFWTFRYFPSFFGVPLVEERAVLVPTAEDDAAIHLPILEGFFQRPAGYLFLTPEEQALVSTRAGRSLRPSAIVGIGLEQPNGVPSRRPLEAIGIPEDYVLYLGRVDRNKGCHTLLEYFRDYAAHHDGPTLVLAGPATLQIPAHPRIRALGYVSDELRSALLTHARALIVPSPYESLSIVLLEGWNHGVPALVNAHCRVLAGQVTRADGGLYYRSSAEFQEALSYLLTHDHERQVLGRQGLAYVEREYRWPTVLERVEALLTRIGQSRSSG